ncbi:MAG TPA: GNAT family N-acetyltransferase, partial [Humisphaera sp.]|nr:GNAT family N-acetyltransferase [Humisphaera sp.]
MGLNLHFRVALCADASHVIAADHIAVTSEDRRQFIRTSIASDSCHIAEWDNHIAGYGVLEYSFFEHGFISMLYVASNARRQGIGSALMRHIEQM